MTGRNRDPIYAPDGRTWYQTALDEAAKRGENELLAALVREWREAQKAIDVQVEQGNVRAVLMAERGFAVQRLIDAHAALLKYADEEMG